MNPIAVNIKNLRREKGLSQEQFAQALHVTRQTVSAWERGVSFWPVLGIIPLFYVMVFWILPLLLSLVVGTFTDTAFLLGGQLFLAIVVVFCYCSLKDEIRNREYYQKEDEESEAEE